MEKHIPSNPGQPQPPADWTAKMLQKMDALGARELTTVSDQIAEAWRERERRLALALSREVESRRFDGARQ